MFLLTELKLDPDNDRGFGSFRCFACAVKTYQSRVWGSLGVSCLRHVKKSVNIVHKIADFSLPDGAHKINGICVVLQVCSHLREKRSHCQSFCHKSYVHDENSLCGAEKVTDPNRTHTDVFYPHVFCECRSMSLQHCVLCFTAEAVEENDCFGGFTGYRSGVAFTMCVLFNFCAVVC